MNSLLFFFTASLFEIGGCFCFWAWARLHRSAVWLVPGGLSLLMFALLLTRVEATFAGRAYAAYGGIYIASSLLWLWVVEHTRPDRYDVMGALVCLAGAGIILLAPRDS